MQGTGLAGRGSATGLTAGRTLAALLVLVTGLLGGCASIVRLDPPPSIMTTDLPVHWHLQCTGRPNDPPDALSRERMLMAERRRARSAMARRKRIPRAVRWRQ
jgi:hypothetical protein